MSNKIIDGALKWLGTTSTTNNCMASVNSGYTMASAEATKNGKIVTVNLLIRRSDSGAFGATRHTIGTVINAIKPTVQYAAFIAPASNAISGHLNRYAGAFISSGGVIIIDLLHTSDVKEVRIVYTYNTNSPDLLT